MGATEAINLGNKRSDRFNIRTTPDEKAMVSLAAQLSRMTTTQFVRQAAVRSAEEVIADQTRFVLSPEKWQAFVEALDRPAREIPALKHAASRPSPFSGR